jgi:hypothetical protein
VQKPHEPHAAFCALCNAAAFALLFLVLVFQNTILCLLNLIFPSQECYVLDVHPWEAAFFKHHKGITHFFHTFTSATQQKQCQETSLSPQHLSFTSQ